MTRLHVIRIAGLFLIALLGLPGTLFGQSSVDRAALMDLYNSTNGANWTNNTNWGSAAPIHDWYGVTQSATPGEFASIVDLRNNNLTGQLPTTWDSRIAGGAFRDLEVFILDQNNISGAIPPEIGQITSLQILSINDNNLFGPLPSDLSGLPNLIFLSFFGNGLSGTIADPFYFMPNLETLQLTFNQFTGALPAGIGQNNVLLNLRLAFNQLSGTIPPDIADGASIRAIALAYNNLTGTIPAQIGGSGTLVELDLDGNPLSGSIPPELGSLPALETLGLEECMLSGPIPEELGNLSQLTDMFLSFNELTGDVPTTFKDLSNLQILTIDSNELVSLPDLSGILNLATLAVSDNFFEFDDLLPHAGIPAFSYAPQKPFDSSQNVNIPAGGSTTLDASAQHTDGNEYQWVQDGDPIAGATSITYDILNADASDEGLYILRVTNSGLPALTLESADIVVSLGSGQSMDRDALMALYDATNGDSWTDNTNWGTAEPLSNWFGVTSTADSETVRYLDLRNNNLIGQLPTEWATMIPDGAFQSMEFLVLSNNSLGGPLLAALGDLGALNTLSMSDNQFTGSIPASFGSLANLFSLNLVGNQLSGSIPEELFSLPAATHLSLYNNQLSGSIPAGLGSNDIIRVLDVSFNNLTGAIPSDIAAGQSLQNLNVNFNDLSGAIPPEIGSSPSLRYFQASGNNLTGAIPPELGSLFFLLTLDLSGNSLSGPIPTELGNLASAEFIELSRNQLTGSVPATLANPNSLEFLYLADNQLDNLPDLSTAPSLNRLAVELNRFEFDDLLPNSGIQIFSYSPQLPFDSPQSVNVATGNNITLDASPQLEDGNQYQWLKDGDPISGATNTQYSIVEAEPTDAGRYTLTVTNSGLSNLTLESAEITVTVDGAGGAATDRDALMALYDATNGDNWTDDTNWGSEEPISEWYGITESSVEPGTVDIIDLRDNNLQGPFPSVWQTMIVEDGVFPNLSNLLLSENGLTGAIPPQIGLLSSLRSISLHSNQLASQIPVVFGDLTNLVNLSLGFNSLSGSIPPELAQLSNLQTLLLHNNLLSGTLPEELGDLSNLQILRVDQNGLGGNVPESLTLLPELEELFVQTNQFESLPDFSGASGLQILNTQNNHLQFDDLEPNIGIPQFAYSPQQPIGPGQSLNVAEGENLTISYTVGGSQNQYQWMLDASPISGATANSYQITNAQTSDEGNYVLTTTSPLVPGLTLITENTFVDVTPSGGGTYQEFVVTNTNDSGAGSLRQAILDANANVNEQGVLDDITFDVPGPGLHVIRPQSALPVITESVTVDGTTQPGSTCGDTPASRDLRIVLDGSQAGNVDGGLVFRDNLNSATVSGLVVNNFAGAGILVDGTPGMSIQCNFIGTDVSGTTAEPNVDGIHAVRSSNVIIGSGVAEAANLVSGNGEAGIRLEGGDQTGGVVIYGNMIGTNSTGTSAVPNSIGIFVLNESSTLIGAPTNSMPNVISGNSLRGVEIRGASAIGTFMVNNMIGTDISGENPVPNGEGIRIHDGAVGTNVGFVTDLDFDDGLFNYIAFNNGSGVVVTGSSTTNNRISGNRMFENDGLGIDLGDDGLTLNDIGDGDEGPNRLINSPQIVSSTIDSAGDLIVNYFVESGGQLLNIEFFEADADGEEGARLLGMAPYPGNQAGQTVEHNLGNANTLGISDPNAIVATATDNLANTSEFSGAGSGPGGNDQITVTEPHDLDAITGGDVQVQATLPSGFNATLREVCYRRTGEAAFTCTQLQASGNDLAGAIPSAFVTARGVQYYFRFSDGTTERTVPENDPENSAFVLPVRVTSLRVGGSFAPDTYRMVSIPVDLLDGSFANVLDEYGEFDPRRWRLLRWEPALQDYAEFPDGLTGGFDPCEAYWLITFGGGGFEVENGQSVDPTQPCFVTVRPGWNQFGSPYAFPVAWSDVNISGAVDGPVAYDASQGEEDPYRYNVEVLQPWQGYWLFNPGSSNVFMSFNPVEAAGQSGKRDDRRILAGDEYEVRLRASLPEHGLLDTRNRIGLSVHATAGFDDLDFAEAPPIGDYVRLSILENDMRLAGSFRPDGGSGQSWDIEITSAVDGAPARGVVRVSLDEFGRRPTGFNMRVVDLDMQQPVRVDADGFEVELTADHPVRRLRLIVGTDAFSEEAGESIPEVPQHAELAQNYPNPFNPSTRIRFQVHVAGPIELAVFDPLGRRIRTLVDGNREPGWYDTVWNGRDESGTAVSSGMYFYVMTTTDGSVSRTMVLLR